MSTVSKVRIGTFLNTRELEVDNENRTLYLLVSICKDCDICRDRILSVERTLSATQVEWSIIAHDDGRAYVRLPFSTETDGDVHKYLSLLLQLEIVPA